MAQKLNPVQLYCVSVTGGTSSTGSKFIIMNVSPNSDAKTGAMKVISEYSDLFSTLIDELNEQSIELKYPTERDERERISLNTSIAIGNGIIFEDTNVPVVIQLRKLEDDTIRRTPLTSVRGVALTDLGESVRGLVEREMIRRCNDREQFLPVKGQDYSRFFYAETTWEEIAKALFPDDDTADADDDED